MRAWVGHFELPVRDLQRAATFYREVFGWRVEQVRWPGPEYYKVRIEGDPPPVKPGTRGLQGGLAGIAEAGSEGPLLVLHVECGQLAALLARIVDRGGAVDREPTAVGAMGAFARFRDPEGNLLGLWEPSQAAGTPTADG